MQPNDVNKLLENFPLGIKIVFRYELDKWQKSTHKVRNISLDHELHHDLPLTIDSLPKQIIKVGEILSSSSQGHLILEFYRKNNKLNDGIRTTLVDIIISYIISMKIPMSVNISESMADQIVTLFPSEVKVNNILLILIITYCNY